jgi:hypothetical protein
MRRPIARTAPTLATLLTLMVATAPASAGEFTVAQCDPANPAFPDARFDRTDGAYYALSRDCGTGAQIPGLRVGNLAPAPNGAEGRISWTAPAGLRVIGISAEANLRSDGGHRARLSYLDGSGEPAGRIATGLDQPARFERYSDRLSGSGRAGFAAQLVCLSPSRCDRSSQARAWIRNVHLNLLDGSPPSVSPAGSLIDPGWLRGSRELAVALADSGGGLRDLKIAVNGVAIAPSQTFPCSLTGGNRFARTMTPCPRSRAARARLDTAAPPFVNGANELTICARDYGSSPNQTCHNEGVAVDNVPPAAEFGERLRSDPELITVAVSDPHSGLAGVVVEYRRLPGGPWVELETEAVADRVSGRVDSRTPPPGRYLFRVRAVDRAGNVTTTSARHGGGQMALDFPLLERTSLSMKLGPARHRVAYRSRPRIGGRLEGASGAGIAGAELELIERFESGARPQVRRRSITTDARGRFEGRLSRGPSRSVEVAFAGSGRYLPSIARPRRLAVEGIAKLRLARKRVAAGKRARFIGRVGALGARIPAPGKVVELQVREAGAARFRTVGEALHTGRFGKVRTTYRFRRFYSHPTPFEFRLKVTRQAGWPYRAPTHSPIRRLTVVPR